MQTWRTLALLATCACLCAVQAKAQDSQSLGDVARQARQQKQQKDSAGNTVEPTAKDAPPTRAAHVYTNDEIPERTVPASTNRPAAPPVDVPDAHSTTRNRDSQAEQWKQRIHQQKASIASLEAEIARVSSSVRYSRTNCYNCAQYNEQQRQKQDQVEAMKSQLEEQKKQLEDLQDQARKQGFGSSVYDP